MRLGSIGPAGGQRPHSSTPWKGFVTPLCELCKTRHHGYQAHVFASNTASNKAHASNSDVQRNFRHEGHSESALGVPAGTARVESGGSGEGADVGRVLARPKQRWSRESYNAYQREYMRRRRRGVTPA